MKDNITVPTGKVVAIGKLKIVMRGHFSFELPTLSFIVAQSDWGGFTASCLHLMLDAHASTSMQAAEGIKDTCAEYIKNLFDKLPDTAFDQLHELFTSPNMDEWWAAYRDFQLNLVEQGRYSNYSIVRQLAERVLQLENETRNKAKDTLVVSVVDYQDDKAA